MRINKKKEYEFKGKSFENQKYEYQKMQVLDSSQSFRYGFYRKSDFKKEKIKKIIVHFNSFLKNINSSDPLIIAIKSLTKSFIGEVIELVKQFLHELEESVDWKESQVSKKIIKHALRLSFFEHHHSLQKKK
jgi:hypothetical protein|eukprot:Tamp_08128.p2 GENE.Tamp_08128~~Tamp_08128.p2  ORF type:complete len:132 (+),score=22.00 Tamp_08128:1739-2134(+)